jgi:uncharacterized membrane protein YhhN
MVRGRAFVPSLLAFLAGHVYFITGLESSVPQPTPAIFAVAAAVVAVHAYRIARGPRRTGQTRLRAPVAVHTV